MFHRSQTLPFFSILDAAAMGESVSNRSVPHTDDVSIQEAINPEKRLFICCDGTWEDSNNSNQPITNVTRFARCIQSKDSQGVLQVVYYQSGIGTVRHSKIFNLP